MKRPMRRKEKKLETEEAFEILRNADYGVLSSVSENGKPYGVPLNHCLLDGNIYFHSATEGHKVDNIRENPPVSFSVVGETSIVPEEFDTVYESAIISGTAEEVFGSEKRSALEALLKKLAPKIPPDKTKCMDDELDDVSVFKITIKSITGKANR